MSSPGPSPARPSTARPDCCRRVRCAAISLAKLSQGRPGVASLAREWQAATQLWRQDVAAAASAEEARHTVAKEMELKEAEERHKRFVERSRRLERDFDEMQRKEREEAAEKAAAAKEAARVAQEAEAKRRAQEAARRPQSAPIGSSGCSSLPGGAEEAGPTTPRTARGTKLVSLEKLDEVARSSIPLPQYAMHLNAVDRCRRKQFAEALRLLEEILGVVPDTHCVPVVVNKALVQLHLQQLPQCVETCLRAIEMDPRYVKAHAVLARAYLLQQNTRQARQALQFLRQPENIPYYDSKKDLDAVEALDSFRKCCQERCFEAALHHIDAACALFPGEMSIESLRIECLIHLRPEEAHDELANLLASFPDHSELLYLRGWLLYHRSTDSISLASAMQYLHKAISNSPTNEHDRAKRLLMLVQKVEHLRSNAAAHANTRRFRQAVAAYSDILDLELRNPRLEALMCFHRGTAHCSMSAYKEGLADLTRAIQTEDCPLLHLALAQRAEAYHQLRKLEMALNDAEESYRINPSSAMFEKVEQLKEEIRQADQPDNSYYSNNNGGGRGDAGTSRNNFRGAGAYGSGTRYQRSRPGTSGPRASSSSQQNTGNSNNARRSTGPTFYDHLGLDRKADAAQVSKAFKQAALKWHPDKWVMAGAAERHAAEENFKRINHAYNVLNQEATRRQYDQTL